MGGGEGARGEEPMRWGLRGAPDGMEEGEVEGSSRSRGNWEGGGGGRDADGDGLGFFLRRQNEQGENQPSPLCPRGRRESAYIARPLKGLIWKNVLMLQIDPWIY